MSDNTNSSGLTPRILYFSGILVAIFAAVFGVFLNWVVALQGMETGVLGINAWWAASVGLVLLCVGIFLWRLGLRGVNHSLHRLGRWVAVGSFVAFSFAAQHVLAASWKVVCDGESPVVCYKLGALVDGEEQFFDSAGAFETACRGGHLGACDRLLEGVDDPTGHEWIGDVVEEQCELWKMCNEGVGGDECDELEARGLTLSAEDVCGR